MINQDMIGMFQVMNDLQIKLDKIGAVAEWRIRDSFLEIKIWCHVNGVHHNVAYSWSENEMIENPFLDRRFDQLVDMVSRKIETERALTP